MRQTLGASVLMLVFCCPAFAGDALCPPGATPPPAVQEPPTAGDIETPLTTDSDMDNGAADGIMGNDAAATFIEVVLNLLALP